MVASLKRIIFVFIALSTLLFVIPSLAPVHADYANSDYAANVPQDIHSLSQSVIIEALNGISCNVAGFDFIQLNTKCLTVLQTGKLGYAEQSGNMLTAMSGMITALYVPQAHFSDSVNYLSANFIKNKTSAYAASTAGTGYDSLSPLSALWTTFRNITYLFFVLLFIVIGLGIMLRFKLDPRTAMTIENSLPKLIIALLLVTFSYAIAGFLIDMMYVSIYVIMSILATADSSMKVATISNSLGSTPLEFVNTVFGPQDGSVGSGIFSLVGNMSYAVIATISGMLSSFFNASAIGQMFATIVALTSPACIAAAFIGKIWNIFGNTSQDITTCIAAQISLVTGAIVWLIGIIALLLVLFRVWWALLKTYVSILLSIMLAPFIIAMGVLPNSKINFMSWLRDMFANLAVFPVVVFVILIARVFADKVTGAGNGMFTPPLGGIVAAGDPGIVSLLKGGSKDSFLGYLIAFALILILPDLIKQVKKALGHTDNGYGLALGAAFGAGAGIIGKATAPLTRNANYNGENEGILHRAAFGWNQQPNFLRRARAAVTGGGFKGKVK